MIGDCIKGDVKDVVAELQAEAQRCKGMSVGQWLTLRKVEKAEAQQLEEIQKDLEKGD